MRLRVCSNDSEYHNEEGDEQRRNEKGDDLYMVNQNQNGRVGEYPPQSPTAS